MRIYAVFLDRVAKGRDRPPEAIDPLAQGRVWTGRQALEHGLVDRLGGVREAIEEASRLAELELEPRIVHKTPARFGLQALTGQDAAALRRAAGADAVAGLPAQVAAWLGHAESWALLQTLGPAVLQGRERVLAWCPYTVGGI